MSHGTGFVKSAKPPFDKLRTGNRAGMVVDRSVEWGYGCRGNNAAIEGTGR
jgi:hypothetical protein